jgi:hypothetical protein
MKNTFKGYVTSTIGLIIMIADIIYFFGFVDFPSPDFTPKTIELGVAFIIGLGLFLMPRTFLEKKVEDVVNKVIK